MKVANVSFNSQIDETSIIFTDKFDSSDWLTKADILRDMIGTLQQHYDAMMGIYPWAERNKFRLNSHKVI